MISTVIFGAVVLIWIACFYLLVRNALVFRYRMRVLDSIHPGDPDFDEALTALDSVSYERMLFGVRRLRTYYRDTYLGTRPFSLV